MPRHILDTEFANLANTDLRYSAAALLNARPTVPTGMKIRIWDVPVGTARLAWMIDGDYYEMVA